MNHFQQSLDDYITGRWGEDQPGQSLGQCPECGEGVFEDQGVEICLGCDRLFHAEGCLHGRYVEGVGFWCVACIDDGKHTEVCPECGEDVKDFTHLDDHRMCQECFHKWQVGELPGQNEESESEA